MGELITGVDDCRTHTITSLTHTGIGKAHDRKSGQPRTHVDLDGHRTSVKPIDGERLRAGKHTNLQISRTDTNHDQTTPRLLRHEVARLRVDSQIGGSADVESVIPGLCSKPVPTLTCVAGDEP
ncbi:MAG TPA: hypothetical protein VFC30_07185, partial [Solirubrobacteraceae bacterium]|nr:hypothetical protein [Solirubrobacteraceae bacterium]